MFYFLETDIREQKKYEKRIHTCMDNAVNDLHYEIKFKTIRNVRNILGIFLPRQTLKNIDMPRQKPRILQ